MNIKGKGWADRQRTKIARQNDINRLTHENEMLRSDNERLARHNESLHRSNNLLTIERNKRVEMEKYEDVVRRLKYFEKAYIDAKDQAAFQSQTSDELRESLTRNITYINYFLFAFAFIFLYLIIF